MNVQTTFAALAAKRIRESYPSEGQQNSYLATIFINDEPLERDLTFVEDLLLSLYEQLAVAGPAVLARYNDYQNARQKGRTASIRINLISKALQWRVAEINAQGQAFLILDNVDQCNAALRELLERELSALQLVGLKIMTTSRLPRYEAFETMGSRVCDYHAGYFETDLYWHCDGCDHDICESCKGDDEYCRTWYVFAYTRFIGGIANAKPQ